MPGANGKNRLHGFEPLNNGGVQVLMANQVEVTYSDSLTAPNSGYETVSLVKLRGRNARSVRGQKFPIVWIKASFDRDYIKSSSIAFLLGYSRADLAIYLNGADIFKVNSMRNDQEFNWLEPIFVQLPPKLLKAGQNEIMLRLQTSANLGMAGGGALIGDYDEIRKEFDRRNLVNNQIRFIVSNVIMVLSMSLLLFWLNDPTNYSFLWLAIFGLARYFRNLLFYIYSADIDPWLASTISKLVPYVYMAAMLGFPATFIKFRHYRKFLALVVTSIGLIAVAHLSYLIIHGGNLSIFSQASTALSLFAGIYLTLKLREEFTLENYIVILSLWGYGLFSSIDYNPSSLSYFDKTLSLQGYSGTAVYFGATLVFLAMLFALGIRTIKAFKIVENLNITLEKYATEATEKLRASEAARREAQVALALETERERIMGEIHDRIGSSLVTTLASARRKDKDSMAVPALKRAITDLKIAVDSLEPVEGDIVALLANLRHRLESDINDAGIIFDWQIKDVEKLNWLDAISALHVLRILQEAIANILAHSGANTIKVESIAGEFADIPCVAIIFTDNGHGFEPDSIKKGRGILGMKSRAKSIGAQFEIDATHGKGTKISLWLPINKPKREI